MPRKRRNPNSVLESFFDTLFFGNGHQNLALGIFLLVPMFAIPVFVERLQGNPLLAAVAPYAKIGVLVFGIASGLCLLAAAIRYWQGD